MTIYSIYIITNKLNNKTYVGYSSNPQKRFWQYASQAARAAEPRPINLAIDKYGIENFEFNIIYQSKDKQHTLFEMEQYFIDQFQTKINERGYNVDIGGSGGRGPGYRKGIPKSKEHKEKIRQSNIKTKSLRSQEAIDQWKMKISQTKKMKVWTDEQREHRRQLGLKSILSPNAKLLTKESSSAYIRVSCLHCKMETNIGNYKKHLNSLVG